MTYNLTDYDHMKHELAGEVDRLYNVFPAALQMAVPSNIKRMAAKLNKYEAELRAQHLIWHTRTWLHEVADEISEVYEGRVMRVIITKDNLKVYYDAEADAVRDAEKARWAKGAPKAEPETRPDFEDVWKQFCSLVERHEASIVEAQAAAEPAPAPIKVKICRA